MFSPLKCKQQKCQKKHALQYILGNRRFSTNNTLGHLAISGLRVGIGVFFLKPDLFVYKIYIFVSLLRHNLRQARHHHQSQTIVDL